MEDSCVAVGWGGGPWAMMAYGGSEFCSDEAADQVVVEPESNVRDFCIVRC